MGLKDCFTLSHDSRERIRKVFHNHASKCSVHGVSFIQGSKYPVIRVLWTVLLVSAIVALAIHLGLLFAEFLRYRKQSVTELEFSILPFPAVTVCNVNAVRMSKIDQVNPRLRQLIKSFDPSEVTKLASEYVPPYVQGSQHPIYSAPAVRLPGELSQNGTPYNNAPPNLTTTNVDMAELETEASQTSPPPSASSSSFPSSFFSTSPSSVDLMDELFQKETEQSDLGFDLDDFFSSSWDEDSGGAPVMPPPGSIQGKEDTNTSITWSGGVPDDYGDGAGEGVGDGKGEYSGRVVIEPDDEGNGKGANSQMEEAVSTFTKVNAAYRILYSAEPGPVRREIGHSLRDFIVHCTFAGRACKFSDFKRISSNIYGNCYTLQYDKFLVADDGPLSGLDLILFLEIDEYTKGFTPSKGAQVVIHQPGTIPFPGDEGFSVSAGMHTMVGLKMHNISRLPHPYGDCSDVDNFKHEYGIIYTRQTCQKLCQLREIKRKCGCFDASGGSLASMLNFTDDIRPCRSERERWCALECIQKLNGKGRKKCVCNNPCNEYKYIKSISSRMWPDEGYAGVFVRNVCDKLTGYNPQCDNLKRKKGDKLRQEFLKVSIYYEDLNYQQLYEVPGYGIVQLVSDIGGTLGLWIGLSLLGFCEIIHLVCSLVMAVCCSSVKKAYTQHKDENVEVNGNKGDKNTWSAHSETTF